MIKFNFILAVILILFYGCKSESIEENNNENTIMYNIIEPGNGIYVITKKNVSKESLDNRNYEAVFYENKKVVKIERYNKDKMLTDEFSVAAVTKFEYDSNDKVKFIKYFDSSGKNSEDEIFGYWSIEYIYDEQNRVRMEIYRDSASKFLTVPRDNMGNIAKVNFIAPILTYEYIDDKIRIKALDQNFNLLKEVFGDKPCILFIDCGDID